MSFSALEFMLSRQRCRQWIPLITQQFRLRHVYRIIGFNLLPETAGSFYFTLHLTTMSAPFYTSEQLKNPHPKWGELNQRDMPNGSASCIVLRIWQHAEDGADRILLTWGVHFSGLCYLGNKIVDVQPKYFNSYSVIFCMQGGFYTSHQVIKTDLQKPIPFISNVNLLDTLNSKVIYRKIAIQVGRHEVQISCNLEKLRRVHDLQVQIRKKGVEVQNIRDKINMLSGVSEGMEMESHSLESDPTASSIRYAPQLLTMNSLNKLLKGKPTIMQKQKMIQIRKEIERAKFIARLLSQEKDRQSVILRGTKQKYLEITEDNEERESDLMENYRKLSRDLEKLKEYKKSIYHHREVYSNVNVQLQQRRRQLLKELLQVFLIEKTSNDKYRILGIHLPNSDILADCADTGFSVALGYIAHILVMSSTFLQVPLRYPIASYGSRSYITDYVSPLLPEKERDFPLFTRGKDRVQFTYAVYLLNKNLAQFRWFVGMNTTDLKATLHNLLTYLQGPKDAAAKTTPPQAPPSGISTSNGKFVSLHSFGSISNISDPILDCIRREKRIERSASPTRRQTKKSPSKQCRSSECGKGLSEILAIPEAYLNRQMSSDSFRNYANSERLQARHLGSEDCCGLVASSVSSNNSSTNLVKITSGKGIDQIRDTTNLESRRTNLEPRRTNLEQDIDALDSPTKLSSIISKTIKIYSDGQLRQKTADDDGMTMQEKRLSRSVGSYADDECGFTLRASFELGSEPLLNALSSPLDPPNGSTVLPQSGQPEWTVSSSSLILSCESLHPDEVLDASAAEEAKETPLMARTDALLTTKSFNLIRPKQ